MSHRFYFNLTGASDSEADWRRVHEVQVKLFDRHGVKPRQGWATVETDTSRFRALLDEVESIRDRDGIGFRSGSTLIERTTARDDEHAWFRLDPVWSWRTRHVEGWCGDDVTETFVNVVRDTGLTGLDCIRISGRTRLTGEQCFIAIAGQPLGRGLDHPWFDVDARAARKLIGLPERRVGVRRLTPEITRAGELVSDPLASRLERLIVDGGLEIESYPRVLKDRLPSVDFAYLWSPEPDPRNGGPRENCLSRRAANVLLAAGVIEARDLQAIEVLDAPPPAARVLDDETLPTPPPRVIQALELTDDPIAEPPPLTSTAVDITALDRALDAAPTNPVRRNRFVAEEWSSQAYDRCAADLEGPVPRLWRERAVKVLMLDRTSSADDITPIAPHELIELNRLYRGLLDEAWAEDAPTDVLVFALTDFGDWLTFETNASSMPDDCPVTLWDHEGALPVRRWPSIGAFLHTIVDGTWYPGAGPAD